MRSPFSNKFLHWRVRNKETKQTNKHIFFAQMMELIAVKWRLTQMLTIRVFKLFSLAIRIVS